MTNPATPGTPGTPRTPGSGAPTPPTGGMPKWLIIALIAGLAIVLVCGGGVTTCVLVGRKAAQQVQEHSGFSVDTGGAGLSVPADFPKDVPLAAGYKILSKMTPPGTKSGVIVLSGASSLKTLSDYYTAEMGKQGWQQVSESAADDGFQQTYSKEKRVVTITGGNGGKDLSITYTSE
jgi:hypothetical protein